MWERTRLTRRNFIGFSVTAIAGALVGACAPKSTPAPDGQGAAVPTTAPGEVATAAPSSGSGDVVTVDFMNWWGAEREPLMNECIAQFEQEHPNIKVTNSVQPWDNREQRAATAIASGTPPSVIMTIRAETYKYAHEGLIVPIDDYVEASGLDLNDFFQADIDNERWGGKLYSLPLPGDGGSSSLFLYNKDLFRQVGFDADKPPETWEELETLAKAVTEIDGGALKVIGTDVGGGDAFPAWLYSNGGEYCSPDGKQLLFNSQEGIDTLQWLVHFTRDINGGIDKVSDFFEGMNDGVVDFPFYTNRHAVWFDGTWAFGHFNNMVPDTYADTDKWGVGLRPYNGANPEASSHGTSGLQWAWGYVIPKSLPQNVRDAAYTWIEWWIAGKSPKEKNGCYFLFQQSQVSAVKECTADQAWYDINPYWGTVMKALETDVSIPITPVQAEITSLLNEAVEAALYETKSPKEALDFAASEGQKILDNFWSEA